MSVKRINSIEVIVFGKDHVQDPYQHPAVKTYLQGARAVQDQLGGRLSGRLSYSSLERHGNAPGYAAFGITRYPTIMFVDNITKRQIARLQGGEITAKNVGSILLSLDTIQRDDNGNYYHPDGRPFIFQGEGDGFGFGLLSFPPWLLALATAALAIKATTSKTTAGKALFGGATLFVGSQYLSRRAQHENAPLPIGRTLSLPA